MTPRASAAILFAWPLLGWSQPGAGAAGHPPTDYEHELAELQGEIAASDSVAAGIAPTTGDPDGIGKRVQRLYRHAALTAEPEDFRRAEEAIDRAMRDAGAAAEFHLLRADLLLKLHRNPEAKRELVRLSDLAEVSEVKVLAADLALQEGRYAEAKAGYAEAVRRRRSWDNYARLAQFAFVTGDPIEADRRYAEAQEQITVKEMRSYAWVELQRGLLDLRGGRLAEAERHYRRADHAYSGYWLTEDYLAEVLGARGKFDEAIMRYRRILDRAPRPEIQQELGDLLAFMGRRAEAKTWHDRALAGYEASVQRGEVHYFHHLAAFHADIREDGAEAVRWARRDLELRQDFAAHDGLAWALYRDGKFALALEEIGHALAPGIRDAHLFYHAAMIHLAAERFDEGQRFLKEAAEINPHYATTFHVHR